MQLPDLILLDIMLPEIDGYELIEYIRPMDIPVIFLTAKSNIADKVKGLRLGAEDYITKPFEYEVVIAKIKSHMRRCYGEYAPKLNERIVELDGLKFYPERLEVKFDDKNIIHVDGDVDPIRDIEIINLELIFSDLDVVEKRIPKVEHKAKSKVDDAEKEYNLLLRLKEHLIEGRFVSEFEMSEEELKMVKSFCFLTQKPMLYIANVSEEDLFDLEANSHYVTLCEYAKSHGSKVIAICAELEAQLSEFDPEERKSYLDDLGISESGLDNLIKEAYDLLGLATFFTAGEKEVRAWTFKKGMKAPQCAGVIHTDFEKGFIRAEVVSYDDLVKDGSLLNAKALGHVRQEGKEYLFKDGDVTLFKFNVTK